MIISRTPARVSFVGGGTDLPDYYRRSYGAVVSTAIKKYIYVCVNTKFDGSVRISYSETENVSEVKDIRHNIIREALKYLLVERGIEVVTIADMPGRGTGLGSSSSLDVGLLNAVYRRESLFPSAEGLARDACNIEIAILKQPIGKQDQYAAAYGGLNYIRFDLTGTVQIEPIKMSRSSLQELESNVLCFHTGIARSSADILTEQRKNIPDRLTILDSMRDQADYVHMTLNDNDIEEFGIILNDAWELKKQLASKITDPFLDGLYVKARKAGALGGKISGAGGGGFLTLYVPEEKQNRVREALKELRELDVKFDIEGSKIIYIGV